MMKRRNLPDVITQIIKEVPNSEPQMLQDLAWCYEDSVYKAPEEGIGWDRVQQVLIDHIPVPQKHWHWKVLSIFTTRSIGELKVLFNTKYDPK